MRPLMASEISTAKTSSRDSKLYMTAATTHRIPFMTDILESLANSVSSSRRFRSAMASLYISFIVRLITLYRFYC